MSKCNFILSIEGATQCLESIGFPASKKDVLSHIEKSGGPEAVIVVANRIADKVYSSMDELLEALNEMSAEK